MRGSHANESSWPSASVLKTVVAPRRGIAVWRSVSVALWVGVVLVGAFDLALTHHGLHLGLVEVNPLGRLGLDLFGYWSLIAGKLLAVGVGVIGWKLLGPYKAAVPLSFIVFWGAAVLSNGTLLFVAA